MKRKMKLCTNIVLQYQPTKFRLIPFWKEYKHGFKHSEDKFKEIL